MLEPDAGKLVRPVLRGGSASNGPALPDQQRAVLRLSDEADGDSILKAIWALDVCLNYTDWDVSNEN